MRYWIMMPLLLIIAWLGAKTEIFAFGRGGLSAMGQAIMAPFFGWMILLVLFFWIAGRRSRKFVKRDSPAILAAVEEAEGGVSPAG